MPPAVDDLSLSLREPLLVNLLGHSAGALIFAIFLFLLWRDRAGQSLRSSGLTRAAATMALIWNAGAFLILVSERWPAGLAALLLVASTSALSLLPAFLLHLSLDGRPRWLVASGYGLGIAASLMHASELFRNGASIHAHAQRMTAAGFAALTIIGAILLFRREAPGEHMLVRRALSAMALAVFSLTFAHFHPEGAHSAWQFELLVHHAGIPLASFILLQDYRFVLMDAFLRFLGNILLAAVFTFGAAQVAIGFGWLPQTGIDPRSLTLLALSFCGMLVLFAVARARLQRMLTLLVFRHGGMEGLLSRLLGVPVQDEESYLEQVVHAVAAALGAAPKPVDGLDLKGLVYPTLPSDLPAQRELLESLGIGVLVPIALPRGESRVLAFGRRAGGRRYLSEDLAALGRMAAQVAEQLRYFYESETKRLVSQAELRALQSQIHPHFLFNALNTLYGIIPREAQGARRTVLNLADIFRYFLRNDRSLIPLGEEMSIVRAYLEIESLRLGRKLNTVIEVGEETLKAAIPVLSLEPLVENAVKHGIASRAEGGTVTVRASLADRVLSVSVSDTGKGFEATSQAEHHNGVALENVRRRLKLCYGAEAQLTIESSSTGSTVAFCVPVDRTVPAL